MPSPINTVEDYLRALGNFEIKEVSDNLFINFPVKPFLYPETLPLAWIGTNHNLYQLMVLNERYREDSQLTNSGQKVQISDEAFAGLLRAIGFGAEFMPQQEDRFYVYDRNGTAELSPTSNEGIQSSYASNANIPSLEGFENIFTRDLIRYGGFTPSELNKYKAEIKSLWSSIQANIFSSSWRRGNTLSMYLEHLGAKPGQELSYETTKQIRTGRQGFFKNNDIDDFAKIINPKNPNQAFREGGEGIYEWWRHLAETYGDLTFNNDGTNNPPTTFFLTQPKNAVSFRELFITLLEEYKKNPYEHYGGYGTAQDILEATLRFHYQFNYQASGLNTQNALPYANSANPFVIGNFDQLNNRDWGDPSQLSWQHIYGNTWIDTFSGNEAWVKNLEFDSLVTGEISPALTQSDLYTTLPKDGWIPLDNAVNFKAITEGTNGDSNYSYQTIHYFDKNSTPAAQAVFFDRDSNSSDTLTARYLNTNGFNINSDTKLKDGTRIKDLGGLVNSNGVLPDSFRSYLSLSGGVDRVTGSIHADVIVGTTVNDHGKVTPGSLNAIAGPGNDVVAPGRGSGSIQLGRGNDKLVIDQYDTLGRTTLFDFTFGEDELVIHPELSLAISDNNSSLLYVFTPGTSQGDDLKTLHLTQASSSAGGTGWTDYFAQYADKTLVDALTEQPPGLI